MIDKILRHPGPFLVLLGLIAVALGLALGNSTWTVLVPVWAGIVLLSAGSTAWARDRRRPRRIQLHLGLGLLFLLTGATFLANGDGFDLGKPWMWEWGAAAIVLAGLLLLVTMREDYISERDTGQKTTPEVDHIYGDHLPPDIRPGRQNDR